MKDYEIDFPEIMEGQRPAVIINGEVYKFSTQTKRKKDTFSIVWKIKARIEALLALKCEYNLCKFKIESRTQGNQSREIVADLSYNKEMKKTAEKIIRKELEEDIKYLKKDEKCKFTTKDLKAYAEHCMIKLLSYTPEGSDMPEIKPEDIIRIKKILNE